MSKLSIIVAIYKSERNIRPFYEDFCRNIKPYIEDYELIMVNDGSPDNSWKIMKELAAKDKKLKLIKLSRNYGAIEAVFTGMKYSSGDCVTDKACDLQEPASLTLEMFQEWKGGAKSVIAVRESRNDPKVTKAFAAVYYWLVRKLVIKDMPQGGFDTYLIDRKIVDQIITMNDRNSPLTLQILWMGFNPQKVYYERRKREIGKSSWTVSKKLKLFLDSFVGFSYIPIRFMSGIGMIFFLISIIWGINLIVSKLKGTIPIQGYTTTLVMLLFSAGLIMFTLGLLGEYVWRTLDAARRRPITIVDELVNMEDEK